MSHWRQPSMVDTESYLFRTKLRLEVGRYYRNQLGLPVFISGEIDASSPFYKKGYRFVSHRGSFYHPDGFISGWPWRSLNLAREINEDDMSLSERVTMMHQFRVYERQYDALGGHRRR